MNNDKPDPNKWMPIESAPRDGQMVWVRSKNDAGRWMPYSKAAWVTDGRLPNVQYFWSAGIYNGWPVPLFNQPLQWQPIENPNFLSKLIAFFGFSNK